MLSISWIDAQIMTYTVADVRDLPATVGYTFAQLWIAAHKLPETSIRPGDHKDSDVVVRCAYTYECKGRVAIGATEHLSLRLHNLVKRGDITKDTEIKIVTTDTYYQSKFLSLLKKYVCVTSSGYKLELYKPSRVTAAKSLILQYHESLEESYQIKKIRLGVPSSYKLDLKIPEESGVFIFMINDQAVCTGSSKNIARRVRDLKCYRHQMNPGDSIKWVSVPIRELSLVHSFYQAKYGV